MAHKHCGKGLKTFTIIQIFFFNYSMIKFQLRIVQMSCLTFPLLRFNCLLSFDTSTFDVERSKLVFSTTEPYYCT